MRIILTSLLFVLLISCTSAKKTYWCGDHPCINKAERESYFKKNMIVEVKELNKKNKKEITELEKIIQQARINEKKRIKDEKKLAKQIQKEEKRKKREEKQFVKKQLKDEKKLAKQIQKKEKRKKKEEKQFVKKQLKDEKKSDEKITISNKIVIAEVFLSDFKKLMDKIIERNKSRDYPDINDMPK